MNLFTDINLINGIKIINDEVYIDKRGHFNKIPIGDASTKIEFSSLVITSNRMAGTIRGLHFQTGVNAEEKIIKCIRGKIFDVAVDLRSNSSTFGRWASVVLSAESPTTLYLPIGIAHGYQSLEDDSQILYGITGKYDPENAHVIRYDDSRLNINWPLKHVNISVRDMSGLSFEEAVKLLK
jgi:dTDP-4-dehydrorhamnose 3,5-epimerase